jgi:membrane fusion protein
MRQLSEGGGASHTPTPPADAKPPHQLADNSHHPAEATVAGTGADNVGQKRAGQPLFRQLAVEAASGTQIGEPMQSYWRGVTVFTVAAFALVGALVAFLTTVEYSPVYRVPSYTDVPGGLIRLRAPVDGTVTTIAVKEGAGVHRGDLLAVIGSDRLLADGGSRHLALTRKLSDERDMLEREIEAGKREAAAQLAMVDRRIAGLRSERQTLRADIQSREQLLVSLSAQSDQLASVAAQGYATRIQASQKHDELNAQESRLATSRGALARVERDVETSEAERKLVDARLVGLIESRRRSSGELDRRILQNDAETTQLIQAPQQGVVSSALIAEGQSVVSGQALFAIAPSGGPLIVRLLIPARAAGSVTPGMTVSLVFRAYPQEKFGQFAAHVESVSDIPSMPTDIPQMNSVSEPVFVAVAALPAELRSPAGQLLKLKPGMLVDALVPVERRTIMEWLLDPILRTFNESAASDRR